ncbi:hypothetical protein [Ornithinicoccus hortensis]|uniref:Uncharacterized protein n=1 Tax=Ornithinicoccus hortensis TaxID=82346 RepID=A0A542YRE9_9MICO|nr:hypothetical protein [Ornithinicoccus hortensis]TQL50628.1 hypothetical protein FB467_1741 [Ornithinicoccus hortensis]
MTTIDCDTCPVRGRHCGDCFVPVLGKIWMAEEAIGRRPASPGGEDAPRQVLTGPGPLDRAEMTAVGAFVRAGLLTPRAAEGLRAVPDGARGLARQIG